MSCARFPRIVGKTVKQQFPSGFSKSLIVTDTRGFVFQPKALQLWSPPRVRQTQRRRALRHSEPCPAEHMEFMRISMKTWPFTTKPVYSPPVHAETWPIKLAFNKDLKCKEIIDREQTSTSYHITFLSYRQDLPIQYPIIAAVPGDRRHDLIWKSEKNEATEVICLMNCCPLYTMYFSRNVTTVMCGLSR